MSEQPPYDGGFDLGGLPGDPLADAMPGADALYGEGPTTGAAPAPAPAPPPPAPPPAVGRPSVRVPRSPGAPVPGAGGPVPVPTRPPRRARRTTSGSRPARRAPAALVAFVVALALGALGGAGRILVAVTGLGDPSAAPRSAPFSVGGGDLGGADRTDRPATEGTAVDDADMVIVGSGLPNVATSVRVLVLPPAQPRHYTVWRNGEIVEEIDAAGGFERRYVYAGTASLLVRADGDFRCRLYVDAALVALTGAGPTSQCRYDPAEIAAAAPGE